jgi:hypothetical protein
LILAPNLSRNALDERETFSLGGRLRVQSPKRDHDHRIDQVHLRFVLEGEIEGFGNDALGVGFRHGHEDEFDPPLAQFPRAVG